VSSASESAARQQSAQEQAQAAYARSGPVPESDERQGDHVTVHDKRRIDPVTGGLREQPPSADGAQPGQPAGQQSENGVVAPADPELEQVKTALAERTTDLQRLKAEFDNYRRRIERDRQANIDSAVGRVLLGLLPTLDDIQRARDHNDLNGTFKTVAEGLENTLSTLGLERFGESGDAFDPVIHEALVYTSAPGLDGPTCVEVYRHGYRHAGRVLRPAQVVVADSASGDAATDSPAQSPDGNAAAAPTQAPAEQAGSPSPETG
jgi:molecular chaperone GrpE